MEKKFNIKSFTKKITSQDPIYLNRAEKEYVLKLMEDVKDYENLLEMYDNRKYRALYLKQEREKRHGLLYPDADEIYMRYFNQKEFIQTLKQKCLEKDAIICDLHNKIMELTQDT